MISLAFILIVVGAITLLQHLDIITLGWGTLWPAAVIAWGVGMLFGRLMGRSSER
jgi:hypothetical protein